MSPWRHNTGDNTAVRNESSAKCVSSPSSRRRASHWQRFGYLARDVRLERRRAGSSYQHGTHHGARGCSAMCAATKCCRRRPSGRTGGVA
ncbi:unnamed protein product [Gadus morhua 'NCC']